MITIRMNLPIPAIKPRASSSAASRPSWVEAKVTAIHGRTSRAVTRPNLGVSVRMHVPSQRTNPVGDDNGPMVISGCHDGGGHVRAPRSAPLPSRAIPASASTVGTPKLPEVHRQLATRSASSRPATAGYGMAATASTAFPATHAHPPCSAPWPSGTGSDSRMRTAAG